MKFLSVSFSIVALVVCAGCAQEPRTSEMGSSSGGSARVYCRDGAWVSSASACGSHGGLERDMSTPSQK